MNANTAKAIELMEQALRLLKADNNDNDRSKQQPKSAGNSAGVAASWDDPEIAAKRSKRWACEVEGELYESVRQACEALGFRNEHSRHIKWRGQLVHAAENFNNPWVDDEKGRKWRVIERTGIDLEGLL